MLLDEYLEDKFVIAGTGSRSYFDDPDVSDIQARLEEQMLVNREAHPNLVVMSGGAQGWDAHVAAVACNLVGIPYVLCIPSKGYGAYYWGGAGQIQQFGDLNVNAQCIEYTAEDVYKTSKLYVGGVHVNFLRNQRMVDLANAFWVYGPNSRGTKDCVSRIEKAKKPYKVLGG